MLRRFLACSTVLLVVSACGGTSSSNSGPTAASIAVQPKDLPSDMHKCDISGDIDSYLNQVKTKDPATNQTTSKEWQDAKQKGATAAYIAFYTDSTAHCASISDNGSDISAATYKLVVNFAIQFKDETSASKGYTSGSIFGFSPTELKSGGAPVVEGTKTGLSANSIVLSVPIESQSYYVAVWQNKAFMVILAVLNIDTATAKKVDVAENSRIK